MDFIFPAETFLNILNELPSAFLIIDDDDDILFLNMLVLSHYNYKSLDLLGLSIHKLIPEWKSESIWEGASYDSEGKELPILLRSRPILLEGESLRAISLSYLGEQQKREALLSTAAMESKLLHKVAAMATEDISATQAFEQTLEHVCKAIKWPIGHVYLVSQDQQTLQSTTTWYLSDTNKYRSFVSKTEKLNFDAQSSTLPGRIFTNKKMVWISNVQNESTFLRNKLSQEVGIQGAFGFPIIVQNQVVAILEFFSEDKLNADQELIDMAKTLGQQISRVVERRRREADLQAALTAKSDFLAMMSHEIRTPINVIFGMADLLSSSDMSQEQKEYLDAVNRSVSSLLSLLNDVLDLSQIEAGQTHVELKSFSLSQFIEQIMEHFQAQAEKQHLQITTHIDDQTPDIILADQMHLHQILINLVGNAVKFTEQGSIDLKISTANNFLRFTIKDTGTGIDKSKMESIFEPFTQAEAVTTRQYGGTGLGLTISQHLIEMMGGFIDIVSEPGSGTTVLFTIPLILETKPVSTEKQNTSILTKPLNILLAEDSEDNRILMRVYFRNTPIKLEEAEDGAIAFEMVKKKQYDLLLLDIQMPNMDGYMTARAIRAWEKAKNLPHMPIIAVTAYAQKEDAQKSYDAGCDRYLTKPIDKSLLLDVISNYE